MQSDVFICSTLVDMYSKCGNMQDSRLIFEKSQNKDFVTWNAMISGYANHGFGLDAIRIFELMKVNNVKPNHATFVSVLRACAHVGLVEKGLQYFDSMLIDKALNLINDMPIDADDVIWRTLLGICKLQKNVEVAEKAASSLLLLVPQDKCICCSWIEVKSELHMFTIADKAHPRCNEIYEKLDELICEMAWSGYVPDTNFTFDVEDILEEKQEVQPLYAVR
ncbi:pentatricopeptide repeat-containing protein [Tanacetum coccineum]